jgi:hypothetical protein
LNRTFLLLLGSLFIYAKWVATPEGELLGQPQSDHPISVEISGAVAKPGIYTVPSGTPLQKALRRSRPYKQVDLALSQITDPVAYWTDPQGCVYLENSCCVEVVAPAEFEIILAGAVLVSGPFRVVAGARIRDLKNQIALTPAADRAFFRRTRLLRPGEILLIPEKK